MYSMRNDIQMLEEASKDFKLTYTNFTKEATKYNVKDCTDTFKESMKNVFKNIGFEDKNDSLADERHQMRMFSFK
jgi:hypothetical protein